MTKYSPFPRVPIVNRTWPEKIIEKAPAWCSVDLRDGNQALATPMSVEKKVEMFRLLVAIGFKEIEVGFPSASQIEFDFIRKLIEEQLIPDDVYLQVLTQAREHLIARTVESLKGAKKTVLHLYNSTSPAHRELTFKMSKDQIIDLAVKGTTMVHDLIPELNGTEVAFEYSPESFSGTELDFALDVCEAVTDVWEDKGSRLPNLADKIILNLPKTVEEAGPHVYADQIEWFCRNMKRRDKAIISLHTHNDRGTGVASTELGLLAGAERVEGTLFGNGERTGNLDIVTVALNMYAEGVDTGLDFHDILKVRRVYEDCTGMQVHDRHPYGGDLVFTAFSGSHQDAIKKGMDVFNERKDKEAKWNVPYLLIDPSDIGRTYEALIRINSQSGKGGIAYVMSRQFGYELPKRMHPSVGRKVNEYSDKVGRELSPDEVLSIFKQEFLGIESPLKLDHFSTETDDFGHARVKATVEYTGKRMDIEGSGNGPINAFMHAMEQAGWDGIDVVEFHEQSIGTGSGTEAAAYIMIQDNSGKETWGVGLHTDITAAGLKALISAYNRSLEPE